VTPYQGKIMSQSISLNSLNRYEIKVCGQPDDSWLGLFGKAKSHKAILEDNIRVTTISNIVMDQAGLVGLIQRLHGIGIVLLSIQQVDLTLPKQYQTVVKKENENENQTNHPFLDFCRVDVISLHPGIQGTTRDRGSFPGRHDQWLGLA